MEVKECLPFVIDTLQKVQLMVKILQDVADELFRHTQSYPNTAGFPSNNPNTAGDKIIGDAFQKQYLDTNSVFHDMPLGSLTTLLNAYLDSTVIASDSILAEKSTNGTMAKLNQVDTGNGTTANYEHAHAEGLFLSITC